MARERSSLDESDVARFSRLAGQWWDEDGPLAPLHALTPVRMALIRDRLADHFGRDTRHGRPLDGLHLLDIGCGGGLLSEPMARLGATVTGIDGSAEAIGAAQRHAGATGLAIDYRCMTAEALAATGTRFDGVVASEVIEHVADREVFAAALARLLRPGGMLVVTTLNRTPRSLLLAKFAAEYVLRMIPRGTHDWRRFVTPQEMRTLLVRHGMEVASIIGITLDPLAGRFRLGGDARINYAVIAIRDGAAAGRTADQALSSSTQGMEEKATPSSFSAADSSLVASP